MAGNEPPTPWELIAAFEAVLNNINVNRKKFDQAQADRYENFVRSLTSEADAIARKQLSATRAAAIAAWGSVVVAIIVVGAQLFK